MMRLQGIGRRRALSCATVTAAVVLVVAGCGSGSSSDTNVDPADNAATESPRATGVSPERTEKARTAALADAKKAGASVAAPKRKTVAFMWLSKSTEASQRQFADLKEAAGLFGFKVIECDPNFDPAKTAQCATSLVARNPSLILASAAPSSAIAAGLKAAHDRGIPWIGIGALQAPSPYLTAQYVPNEERGTQMLDSWLFDMVDKRVGDKESVIGAFQAPQVGPGVIARDQQRTKDLAKLPGLSQKTHDIDLSDPVQDTIKTTKTLVQQNPGLVALWNTCDLCAAPMAQALDQLGLSGDKRPFTAGYYTTRQSRQMIKDGKITGAVEVNFGAMAWVALDQALEHWARGTEFAADSTVFDKGYGIKLMQPWIVTKTNIGDVAVVRNQAEDYVTYFKTKWHAEFGVGAAS
jgi:ABC-type sugar transport system substrate-binding protein